ncbi:unnamed protein product [Mytilus coruscus]|uniref:Uncharacterized protein n=1 Tax=Mytilus coruscus TaxID=42192 RepID=A0A6J8C723_MYTCO|nr:unnamed protein product [Mytilus coruscus]
MFVEIDTCFINNSLVNNDFQFDIHYLEYKATKRVQKRLSRDKKNGAKNFTNFGSGSYDLYTDLRSSNDGVREKRRRDISERRIIDNKHVFMLRKSNTSNKRRASFYCDICNNWYSSSRVNDGINGDRAGKHVYKFLVAVWIFFGLSWVGAVIGDTTEKYKNFTERKENENRQVGDGNANERREKDTKEVVLL